jgi:hypothetical protein
MKIMHLNAVSIGYAVPRNDFTATVHSVFRSAVNLQVESNSELLTIIANNRVNLPQGIRINAPKTFSLEEIRTGEIITCQGGKLQFEDSSLTINLHNARSWKCNLPSLMADMTNPAVVTAWRSAWKVLDERQECSVSEFITENLIFSDKMVRLDMLRKVEEEIHDLVNSTRQYNLTDPHAVGTLIGLGVGLTPSCDDFLVGYLAGLWCTVQGRNECVQFISDLGKVVLRLSSNTNAISRTYLYHATYGQISSLLVALAASICQGENTDNLFDIAEAAMQVGHTSGIASIAGLLLGLAVWDGDHLLNDIIEI